jgi:signal transduction histidine kinase
MRSVRFRVTAIAAAAVLVTLVVAGTLLVVGQRRSAINDIDESLAASADNVAAVMADGRLPSALGGFGDDDAAVQVVSAGGHVVASTANIAGADPIAPPPATEGDQLSTTALAPQGDRGRLLVRALPNGDGYIVLGATLDDVADRTMFLLLALLVMVPLVVLVLAAVVWWLTGRTLAPVDEVCAELDAMAGGDDSHRIKLPVADDEIGRLVRTVNRLLDRIDEAGARQRRFVADASHELRSPLARIRAELEVDLAHPVAADPTATHRSVLQETAGLEALVDDLLVLAALDHGAPPRREPVDLAELVEIDQARRSARGDERIVCDAAAPALVTGDRAQLVRVVRNLVDNAERHARARVVVTVRDTGSTIVVHIEDDGPGVATEDAARVFERFARVDDARTRAAGGTGLGLAIVAEVARAHGGRVGVERSALGGADFIVELPRSSAPTKTELHESPLRR